MSDWRRGIELVAGAGLSAALTIATIVYVGRLVGPVEYADFSAGLAVVYLVGLVLSPLTPTVARIVTLSADSSAAIREAIVRKMLWWSGAAIVVAALAVVPLGRWLNFRSPATIFLAIVTALLYALLSVDRGVLQGRFRFREYNLNVVLEAAFRAVLIAALGHYFRHATFAMLAWALAALLAESLLTLTRARSSIRGPEPDWNNFLRMLRPMVLLTLSIAVFQNTDVLAAKRWLEAPDAGAYGAANALTRAFGVLFVPLYVLVGPVLTDRYARGQRILGTTLRFCLAFVALSSVPLLMLLFWPDTIVRALYGVAFVNAALVIGPLAGVTVMTYTTLMLSQAPITTGDYRFARITIAAALLQIVLLAIFHSSYLEIVTSLYVSQAAALLVVAALVIRLRPAA